VFVRETTAERAINALQRLIKDVILRGVTLTTHTHSFNLINSYTLVFNESPVAQNMFIETSRENS